MNKINSFENFMTEKTSNEITETTQVNEIGGPAILDLMGEQAKQIANHARKVDADETDNSHMEGLKEAMYENSALIKQVGMEIAGDLLKREIDKKVAKKESAGEEVESDYDKDEMIKEMVPVVKELMIEMKSSFNEGCDKHINEWAQVAAMAAPAIIDAMSKKKED